MLPEVQCSASSRVLPQVWAEVKLGEERERILSAIAQASETHVKILQEELCKVLLLVHHNYSIKLSNHLASQVITVIVPQANF